MTKLLMVLLFTGLSFHAAAESTASGIPLNSAWKVKAYDFAKKTTVHPAWGLPHAERNYHVTKELAAKEGFKVDEEVLFAAAFLHDVGGFAPYFDQNVDHAVKSAEVVLPMLKTWGFPAEKLESVKELILGHVYYGPAPKTKSAQAFRDADVLDFLGAIGIARVMAITPEASPSLNPTLSMVKDFRDNYASTCSLHASQEEAKIRSAQMDGFLNAIEAQGHGAL